MIRRTFLQSLGVVLTFPLLPACSKAALSDLGGPVTVKRLSWSHNDWRGLVSAEAYRVLFEEATEASGSSPLNKEKREGTYVCAACRLPLFNSEHKFESGTGWPSFTQPIAGHIETKKDFKLLLPRTEYHCAHCGGHQGHVFDDGPKPRGERWCNNGVALQFVPKGEALPDVKQ